MTRAAEQRRVPRLDDRFRPGMGQLPGHPAVVEPGHPAILHRLRPRYRVHESLVGGRSNEPSEWLTFNQFFGRRITGGLRPIAETASNLVVTSPADCVFQHAYDIDADSNVPAPPSSTRTGTATSSSSSKAARTAKALRGAHSSITCCSVVVPPFSHAGIGSGQGIFQTAGRFTCTSLSRTASSYPATAPPPATSSSRTEAWSPSTPPRPTGATSESSRSFRRNGACVVGGTHRCRGDPDGQGRRVRVLPVRRFGHHRPLPGRCRSANRYQRGLPTCRHAHRACSGRNSLYDRIRSGCIVFQQTRLGHSAP